MSRKKSQPVRVTVTRYYDARGNRVPKGTPGAVKRTEKTESYYAWLRVDGKLKRVPLGTADLGEAWAELRRLKRREAERAAGVSDDWLEQMARPLQEHIDDWLASVADRGTSEAQVDLLRSHVEKLAALAGWRRLGDLTAETLLRALARMQRPAGDAPGVSAQTRNHYTRHAKQFSRWCCRTRPRRLHEDPFDCVELVGVEADRRHDRRSPSDAEVAALFDHLEAEPPRARVRCGMTGRQRALGYKVSMATGFRAGELRSLSRESFDLAAATVTCRAEYSKRGRLDTQQLPAWLVAELKAWFKAGGGCWQGFPRQFPGRLLKADLKAAGVAWEVAGPSGPLFFDFHSLRHWYVTQVANLPGISPRALMALCRHSTPALTLKVYAKAQDKDLRAAAEQIPQPGKRRPGKGRGQKP